MYPKGMLCVVVKCVTNFHIIYNSYQSKHHQLNISFSFRILEMVKTTQSIAIRFTMIRLILRNVLQISIIKLAISTTNKTHFICKSKRHLYF